jgi:predicted RNA-binding Zn-ribbon protein involved in translation (DUF1610 family)
MSDDAEFACPRCMERVRVSDDALLNEREISFECANCGKAFTVHNSVPDAMEKHFDVAVGSYRRATRGD